jgi:FHA domain
MDAMMLVEVLDVHGHIDFRLRISGIGGHCRIGRSLGCEVVVDDAYAAGEHTLLTLQQDGRVHVQDLGTRNGTRVDGRRLEDAGAFIAKGELLIGRTRVLVRTPDADLPPERAFRRDLLRRHRTLLSVVGVALCLAFAAFLQWTDAPERLAPRILIAELAALCILAAWVGAWSLVSRLTVGAWQLRMQLAIAAFCLGLWAWGHWLYTVADFALQWHGLGVVMAAAAAGVALVAAYLHLRYATHLRRSVSMLLAVLAPLLCGGVWWLADLQLNPRTVNRVELGARVYPAAPRLAPSTDLGDYLTDIAALKRDANRNRQESLLETPIFDADD